MRCFLPRLRQAARGAAMTLLAIAGLAGPAAVALAAPSTYSGEAPVASQSEGERNEALKTALAAVVIRLSGDSGALARSDVARAVAEAPRLVLQYQYRRDAVVAADGQTQPRLLIVAEFDAAAVDQMLARLALVGGAATVAEGPPGTHRLWIAGIRNATDYARLFGYLGRQALVREARPLEARGDGVLVEVGSTSGLARLLETVGSEGTLGVTHASPPVDGIDATLALLP